MEGSPSKRAVRREQKTSQREQARTKEEELQPEEEQQPLLQEVSRDAVVINMPSGTGEPDGAALKPSSSVSTSTSKAAAGTEPAESKCCRICFDGEEEPGNPLISPCHCTGSSAYVHRACLQQWRLADHRRDAFYQCEVCHFKYQFRRMWWAGILGSRITLVLAVLLVVSAATWVLGYIPLLQSLAPNKDQPMSTTVRLMLHVLNGMTIMGICGIVLSMAAGTARACGVAGLWWLPDPWCPICADCPGGAGLPWVGECGSLAECGVAVLIVLVAVGFVVAIYAIYGVLFVLTQQALEAAQHMVENVAPADKDGGGGS